MLPTGIGLAAASRWLELHAIESCQLSSVMHMMCTCVQVYGDSDERVSLAEPPDRAQEDRAEADEAQSDSASETDQSEDEAAGHTARACLFMPAGWWHWLLADSNWHVAWSGSFFPARAAESQSHNRPRVPQSRAPRAQEFRTVHRTMHPDIQSRGSNKKSSRSSRRKGFNPR